MTDAIDVLRLLVEQDIRVFPCRGKAPMVRKGEDWRDAATTDLDALVALSRVGPCSWGAAVPSGLLVVDLDCKPGQPNGLLAWGRLVQEHGSPPKWAAAQTPSGGRHIWLRCERDVGNATGSLPDGIDIRGGGRGYVIVPPSSGYSWLLPPGNSDGHAPDWLLGMLDADQETRRPMASIEPWTGGDLEPYASAAYEREVARVATAAPGSRNRELNVAAYNLGQLVGGGVLGHAQVESALLHAAMQSGLKESESRKTIASGMRAGSANPRRPAEIPPRRPRAAWRPPDDDDGPPPHADSDAPSDVLSATDRLLLPGSAPTDIGNAEAFVALHGDGLRYCYEMACWLTWDGDRWRRDSGAHVDSLAQATAKLMLRGASHAEDAGEAKSALSRAIRLGSTARLRGMLQQAQPMRAVGAADLDAQDWLLPCRDGRTVDLRSGQDRPSAQGDLMTRVAGARMPAGAAELECPRWAAFLDEIFEGDQERIDFMRRCAGYSLTGDTTEQCLLLLVGREGCNGKSTMLNTLCRVWGEYAYVSAISTFMSDSKGRNKDPAIAELHGPRLVVASEPEAGAKLDESLIKRITGSEPLTAARKYEREFTFLPRCKLWLACNTPPRLPRGGSSMARRMLVVPFRHVVPPERRDKGLEAKLAAEAPAILHWALRGCLEWQGAGLAPPESVIREGREYMEEQDPIAEWLRDSIAEYQGGELWLVDVHERYVRDMESAGSRPVSVRALAGMLRERGYELGRRARGRLLRDVTWVQ